MTEIAFQSVGEDEARVLPDGEVVGDLYRHPDILSAGDVYILHPLHRGPAPPHRTVTAGMDGPHPALPATRSLPGTLIRGPALAPAFRAVLAVVVSASLAPALRPSPSTGIGTTVRSRADSAVGSGAGAAVSASGSVLRTACPGPDPGTARGSVRTPMSVDRTVHRTRAADAAVTGYPTTPAPRGNE